MEHVILKRLRTGDTGTFGELLFKDKSCVTGELPWRDNKQMISCIPPGIYQVAMSDEHKKFGPVYKLQDVPGRTAILMHSGNLCGDVSKGYKSHVEGCILFGLTYGAIEGQDAVMGSILARAKFEVAMDRAPFVLKIIDEVTGANYGS